MENPMKALVGKCVVRIVSRNEGQDRSYMMDPIRIVKVGQSVAYYEYVFNALFGDRVYVLPADLCDVNWEVVDEELLAPKQPTPPEHVAQQPLEKSDADLGEEQTQLQPSGDEGVL